MELSLYTFCLLGFASLGGFCAGALVSNKLGQLEDDDTFLAVGLLVSCVIFVGMLVYVGIK